MPPDAAPRDRPQRDMALYERLIRQGIAEADARGSSVDHLTARRISLWLLPRSQEDPDLMRGLVHFARTGAITNSLRTQLRRQARSPNHPYSPQAGRLLQYAVARGAEHGRIGDNFGAVCDQIDQADAMLEDLRNRAIESRTHPRATWQPRRPPESIAMAQHDEASQTVTLIIDTTTAGAVMHAIGVNAMEREARIRRVQQQGQNLPEGSYGRENRETVIARERRIAAGLRAVEQAYRVTLEQHHTPAPELSQIIRGGGRAPDHDRELE
jgi:hypothetical protein